MNNKTPLIASIVIHVVIMLLSFVNCDSIFKSKLQSSNYAVFDFVQIGEKSKAPILSDTEGRLSKTKARTPEKETVNQKSQPEEASKTKDKQETKEPQKPTKSSKPQKNKKEKEVSLKSKKKESPAKKNNSAKSTNAKEKAVVNLRKNKGKKNTDPKAAKKSFDSLLDGAIATGDNENSGIKAEEVGDVLTATQVDLIRQTIRKCWHFPAGLKNAEDLVVDIEMELDQDGTVKRAKIVDTSRMNSDPEYKIAAENAYRAVLDPECNPLPLPKDKYEEWKNLELSFNPKEMFE